VEATDFAILQNLHMDCGARPASCPFRDYSGSGVALTTHIYHQGSYELSYTSAPPIRHNNFFLRFISCLLNNAVSSSVYIASNDWLILSE